MNTEERQQSLINARRACEWLARYTSTAGHINATLKENVASLIAGFEILDEKELRQAEAGRAFGHLGAKHGKKGGRPKGSTKNGGKK